MNRWTTRGLLFLLISIFGGLSLHAQTRRADQTATEVKTFLDTAQKSARRSLTQLREFYGDDFKLEFSPLYAVQALDYRDRRSAAWVVGYSLGTAPGNGLLPIRKASLVDRRGSAIADFDESSVGDSAVVSALPNGAAVVFFSGDSGRPYNGWVKSLTLEAKPQLIWSYESPPDQAWYSTISVLPGGDSFRLLIDKTLRDFSARTKRHEFFVTEYDDSAKRFGDLAPLSKSAFHQAINSAGKSAKIVTVEQGGPPYDENVDSELKDLTP